MNYLKAAFLFLFISSNALAQRVCVYDFNKGLQELTGACPPLRALGREGFFTDEFLPEIDVKRAVYIFEKNSGVQFDNSTGRMLDKGNYTIEMYFKFDSLQNWKRVIDFKNGNTDNGCYILNGKLNFYNYAVGDKAPVRKGEYVHYVFARDAQSSGIKMYVDGKSKIEFPDKYNEALLNDDNVLNFFQDDQRVPREASPGAVALIKIYDRVLDPKLIKENFDRLKTEIETIAKTTTQTPPTNLALPTVAVVPPKPEPKKEVVIAPVPAVVLPKPEPKKEIVVAPVPAVVLPKPEPKKEVVIAPVPAVVPSKPEPKKEVVIAPVPAVVLPKPEPKKEAIKTPAPAAVAKAKPQYYLQGQLVNTATKQSVMNATVLVMDSNMVEIQQVKVADGRFRLPVLLNCEYNLVIDAMGFFSMATAISRAKTVEYASRDNIFRLQPVEIGRSIVLKTIRFKQSKNEFLAGSNDELDKLVGYLREYARVEIELHGHTDNQDDFQLNLDLSRQRAELIKTYLTENGIAPYRIVCKGFGGTRPVASNAREETRQFNRRVEMIIRKN